jgi:hypothetical protein
MEMSGMALLLARQQLALRAREESGARCQVFGLREQSETWILKPATWNAETHQRVASLLNGAKYPEG